MADGRELTCTGILIHVFMMGPIKRYVSVLKCGFQARNTKRIEDYLVIVFKCFCNVYLYYSSIKKIFRTTSVQGCSKAVCIAVLYPQSLLFLNRPALQPLAGTEFKAFPSQD